MPPKDRPTSKAVLGHHQVPELVLQDDSHLLWILLAHARRQPHAVGPGVEGDVEVVLARQAVLGGIGEHGPHDAAQGLLGQKIVANVVDGHGTTR